MGSVVQKTPDIKIVLDFDENIELDSDLLEKDKVLFLTGRSKKVMVKFHPLLTKEKVIQLANRYITFTKEFMALMKKNVIMHSLSDNELATFVRTATDWIEDEVLAKAVKLAADEMPVENLLRLIFWAAKWEMEKTQAQFSGFWCASSSTQIEQKQH